MQERWLSVEEIAAPLGVNPDTIYKWLTRKKMPGHKPEHLLYLLASIANSKPDHGQRAEDVAATASPSTAIR